MGKAHDFRALHEGDPFIIPNPWDAGSARVLAKLGFKALASTSSGFAFTLGRPDGSVTLDEVIAHTAALDRATDLPVAIDLEHGYGPGLDEIRLVCHALSRPVNVLARPSLTMSEIVAAGAQRVSVGGALTWVAVAALVSVAEDMRDRGDFSALGSGVQIENWV